MTDADNNADFIFGTGDQRGYGRGALLLVLLYPAPTVDSGRRAGMLDSNKGLDDAPCRISNQRGRPFSASQPLGTEIAWKLDAEHSGRHQTSANVRGGSLGGIVFRNSWRH